MNSPICASAETATISASDPARLRASGSAPRIRKAIAAKLASSHADASLRTSNSIW